MANMKIIAITVMLVCLTIAACSRQDTSANISNPTLGITQQGENAPLVEQSFYFDGYLDYEGYLQGTDTQILGSANPEKAGSGKVTSYIKSMKNAPESVLIPFYTGEPLELRTEKGLPGICIKEELYGLVWTWFYTDLGGDSATVRLSKLSDEHLALANGLTCSEFIGEIAPDAPNITNYQDKKNYAIVYEEIADIDGIATSILIKRTQSGEEYFSFLKDGYLVIISAPVNTVTINWLNDFSLAAL